MDPTRRLLHTRLSNFVTWIKPDEDRLSTIREQADRLRTDIRAKASEDGVVVTSTPQGGSLAKNTGLRRHLTGGSEVEGMDVDLHFVVKPKTRDQEELDDLLRRFERYTKAACPGKSVERTKNSVKIAFTVTKLSYDVVPMLATDDPETQILIRRDHQRVWTSVQRHAEFVKARTRKSNEVEGRVKFNECVRLLKWWREFKFDPESLEIPSLALELLAAAAFDARGVQLTYHETLGDWFGWMANTAQRRARVAFWDFQPPPAAKPGVEWELLDAVNPANNMAAKWARGQIDHLATCLAEARDGFARALRADLLGQDAESLKHLVDLFGSPIKHHCGST